MADGGTRKGGIRENSMGVLGIKKRDPQNQEYSINIYRALAGIVEAGEKDT